MNSQGFFGLLLSGLIEKVEVGSLFHSSSPDGEKEREYQENTALLCPSDVASLALSGNLNRVEKPIWLAPHALVSLVLGLQVGGMRSWWKTGWLMSCWWRGTLGVLELR